MVANFAIFEVKQAIERSGTVFMAGRYLGRVDRATGYYELFVPDSSVKQTRRREINCSAFVKAGYIDIITEGCAPPCA